ncbi:MAG: hypothetical protein ACYC9Z_11035 [Casimicrobiaceae bacterium]
MKRGCGASGATPRTRAADPSLLLLVEHDMEFAIGLADRLVGVAAGLPPEAATRAGRRAGAELKNAVAAPTIESRARPAPAAGVPPRLHRKGSS